MSSGVLEAVRSGVLECEQWSFSGIENVVDDIPPGQGEVGEVDLEGDAPGPSCLLPPVEHLGRKTSRKRPAYT